MAKYQGKIINWNDDKGFGFVEPNSGGVRAFVHIKAFTGGSRRPVNGDAIIYELVKENNNRYKANNATFVSDYNKVQQRHVSANRHSSTKPKNNILGLFLTIGFCIALTLAIIEAKIPVFVGFGYLIISLITMLVYAKDKYAAQRDYWRTPEATLHSLALIGGWPGALFAQKILRHKTSKSEFISTYRFTVFLNVATLLLIFTEQGQMFLHRVILPLLNELQRTVLS